MLAFITLTATKSEDVPDITLISQKISYGKKYDMTCVVSGNSTDSAIAWIESTPFMGYDTHYYVSQYVPPRSSQYNCDIDFVSEACNAYWAESTTGWTRQRSFYGTLQPVIDHRWEEFEIRYTSGSYEFKKIAYMDKSSFRMHLSIRIERDAHLYLCDSDYPPYANCYWILLGAYNGYKTGIRKCTEEKVPAGAKVWPQRECWILRDSANVEELKKRAEDVQQQGKHKLVQSHRPIQKMFMGGFIFMHLIFHNRISAHLGVEHDRSDLILNEMEWKHFTIEKNANTILLWRIGHENPLLNYTDQEAVFDAPYYLNIRSDGLPGYWKLHNYVYTFTSNEITTVLGGPIFMKQTNLCLTMFVAMCSKCILKFEVLYFADESIIKTLVIQPKKEMTWQEEKVVETLPAGQVYIKLRVSSECPSKNCDYQFWAIDDFQMCSEKEIRVLSIEQDRDKAFCQAIKYPHWRLIQTDVYSGSSAEANCPLGTFGKSCTECSKVLGSDKPNCDKSIICKMQRDGQSVCRCATGYAGTACENSKVTFSKCSDGWYGSDCKEPCGYCMFAPCDFITGTCTDSQCLNNFVDAHCKTPPLPVLLNPPKILNVGHTSFTVQIQNNTYEGLGKPSHYKVQYKLQEEENAEWTDTEAFYYFNNRPIEIRDLNILTTYVVRAILITQDNQFFDKDYVPKINLTTTCAVIEERDITIQASNISAALTFANNSESCGPESYQVVVNHKRVIELKNFSLNFGKLKPVTTYHLTVTNLLFNKSVELEFTTEEGVPEQVQQLRVTNQDVASITVSWKPPKVTNGNVKHYIIKCKHTKYTACAGEHIRNYKSEELIQEESTSTVIGNLLPYSEYLIEVAAVTVMQGKSSTISGNTLQTDAPEESEIPTVTTVEPGSTYVKITLKQPNCTLIKGPLTYYLTADCTNMWCLQEPVTKNITHIGNKKPIGVSKLQPYSNYTIKIKVGRSNGNVFTGSEITVTFNTKPSVPNNITSVAAYSKNESSVFLRFKPPFPPTGEIAQYFLKWCYKMSKWGGLATEDVCKYQYFQPRQCKLWTDFHCVSLEALEQDQLYTLGVQAKNEGTNFSDPTSIEVRTVQENPGALTNLTYKWDNYYNLTLTWNHPSITNGPLKKFIVIIFSKSNILCCEKDFPISEENYSRTYSYVVPLEKCYSSKLSVRAAAFNIFEGAPAILPNVPSPPKTPTFGTNVTVEAVTSTTITIKLPTPKDLENNSVMYVLVSNVNSDLKLTNMAEKIPELWCKAEIPSKSFSWIAAEFDFKTTMPVQQLLIIGNNTKSKSTRLNREIRNQRLHANTSYIITLIAINEFEGLERYRIQKIKRSTSGMKSDEQNESNNYGLLALLLLLILPVILLIVIRKKRENKVSWLEMLNMSGNLANNRRNPDVVPLAKNIDEKPTVVQSQLRPKRKIPTEEVANLGEPSTSNKDSEFSKPVKIIEFEKYVRGSIENGELERQHQLFPRGQTKSWDYGLLPQNKSKNRYNNLIAYDHTRVKLAKINNDPYSDYINANYIEGYNTKKAYIATQGPKAATVNDFWRMIWQENVNYIVMLANIIEGGKKKSEQYWPNVNEYLEFGNIKVEYVSSRVFADYEYRTFLVSCNNVERRVEQLHFTSWPDHGVPLYSQSLVPFLRKLLTIPQGSSPIVVHCSAGVGRTGTIILCDLCLRMAAREGVVDVLRHQHNLRQQRANLVDNIEQYKLAHLVLVECLVALQTSITCDEEMEGAVLRLLESDRVAQQMKYLEDTAWQDQAMRPPMEVTPNPAWATKNRFQDIIPCGYGRVYLSRYPVNDEHSDYINAVEVDGFRAPQRFIVTQQPLRHTVSDFWRMVDEKEVTTIVSLNKINLGDETSCVFWPTAKVSEMQPVPFITLQFVNKSNTDNYSVITIHLRNLKDKENTKRIVNLIVLKGWPASNLLPDVEESLLKLWEETERLSRGDNFIVVTCYDGAKASGLFLALSFVVEKMKLEQECDVCLAVRTVRHNRKQFVTEIDQFMFLYRAAISYLSRFDLYSNFTTAGKK